MTDYRQTYEIYLISEHWKGLRQECVMKAKGRCEACAKDRGLTGHHLKYRTPLESCTVEDIMCLCWGCHKTWHEWLDKFRQKQSAYNRQKTAEVIRQIIETTEHNSRLPKQPLSVEKIVGYPSREEDMASFLALKPEKRSAYANAMKLFMKRASTEMMFKLYQFAHEMVSNGHTPGKPPKCNSRQGLNDRISAIEKHLGL
jgi:hypothetical protein